MFPLRHRMLSMSAIALFFCHTLCAGKPDASPVASTQPVTEGRPLALHPDNPHYFLFRGKPAVLISSGEHYGAVLNLDFDYVRYLNELQSCDLNHTRLWAGTYHEVPGNFGIADNTLAPAPGRYIAPWLKGPGGGDGKGKFDLTKFNPAFFDRLKDFLTRASQRGIVVEVNLFCPNYDDSQWGVSPMNPDNNVNHIAALARTEAYALGHPDLLAVQDAFVRKIVAECRDFDNLCFEVCNEPYFGGVTMDWQNHIVDVICDAEKDLPARHLISMNVANGSKKVPKPNPSVSIFNFHYCTRPNAVAENWELNKVIGENETGFKGSKDVTYRTEGWNFVLAGGGLYDSLDYSFTVDHPDGSLAGYKAPGGGSSALRRQLKVLHEFIDGFDFLRMKPDNGVIKSGIGPGVTARVLAEPGRQYAIYLTGGKQVDLKLELPAGAYSVQWLNPATGKVDKSEALTSAGGVETLHSPDYTDDLALSVKAAAKRY
jgi:hypothetical protein